MAVARVGGPNGRLAPPPLCWYIKHSNMYSANGQQIHAGIRSQIHGVNVIHEPGFREFRSKVYVVHVVFMNQDSGIFEAKYTGLIKAS